MTDEIRTISRDELKAKLDRGDDFRLVMTLHEFAFQAAHIPGSEHYPTIPEIYANLDPDEEIVVYCSDEACVASKLAYQHLVEHGFTNVRRYAGGLSDWHAAGLPLEGARPD